MKVRVKNIFLIQTLYRNSLINHKWFELILYPLCKWFVNVIKPLLLNEPYIPHPKITVQIPENNITIVYNYWESFFTIFADWVFKTTQSTSDFMKYNSFTSTKFFTALWYVIHESHIEEFKTRKQLRSKR